MNKILNTLNIFFYLLIVQKHFLSIPQWIVLHTPWKTTAL